MIAKVDWSLPTLGSNLITIYLINNDIKLFTVSTSCEVKNVLEKMKINEDKMKMKICNFFNIAFMGLKITKEVR